MVVYFIDITISKEIIDLQGRTYKLREISYEESLHYNKRVVGLLQHNTPILKRDKILMRLFSDDEVASWFILDVLE